jgi:uracil-DNA glycosylase family 4
MVIGKMPGREEVAQRRTLVGATGQYLAELLERILPDQSFRAWYVTNILKHTNPDAAGEKAVPPMFIANCRHLLFQELAIVRPKFILCLGADAAKALFGTSATITRLEGQVLDYQLPGRLGVAKAMVVIHPAQVLREPHREIQLETNLYRFGRLVQGADVFESEEGRDYRVIDTEEELRDWIAEVRLSLAESSDPILAVDAEWHGEHPQNHGSYLRTIQVAWDEGKAACIRLRQAGGAEIRPGWEAKSLRLLSRKLFPGVRVCGHFFNADLEMLVANGLDLRANFLVPTRASEQGVTPWDRTRTEGGFDTALASHAIDETGRLKLELLALRYTNMRRWDGEVRAWVASYCSEQDIKADDLEGYGMCPDRTLIPYSLCDADATLRLYRKFQPLLDRDHRGLSCRKAFWHAMIASPGAYEINTTGLLVDRERLDRQHDRFASKLDELLGRLRAWAEWPEFNLNSVYHVRELMFGPMLTGKKGEEGEPVSVAPEGARSLHLDPVFDTSKRPVLWEKLVQEGRDQDANPSTGKTALSILYYETQDDEARKILGLLRDCKFINQTLKFTLRPPAKTKEGEPIRDDRGQYIYTSGFGSYICDDDRIRTHMLQTAETGRWKAARPPMQNWSKTREEDYKRILADNYSSTVRSVFRASPGTVLVEFDFKGAELFVTAVMAGDETMIDHVYRNKLDEADPNYTDIHSSIAVKAFKLDCPPTKSGLKSVGKAHLRNAAKATIFGTLYGRQAKAIAIGCREQGVTISSREAQQLLDAIFSTYPGLHGFFAACQDRAIKERWLSSCMGRLRRFAQTSDYGLIGDFQRQAMNFPIQGAVADVVNTAVSRLRRYRLSRQEDLFRIVLQIHDAIMLEVPYAHVPEVVTKVVPVCAEQVPVYQCTLDGFRVAGAKPHYLSSDVEICEYWGEKVSDEWLVERGILIPKKEEARLAV